MKKRTFLVVILGLLMARVPAASPTAAGQTQNRDALVVDCTSKLARLFELRDRIKDIHPFLDKLYPVAVAEGNRMFIFTPDEAAQRYVLDQEVPAEMPIPKGIRAAFPLGTYGNRMACVVSAEVFDDLAGYVTIFHEFVHCRQWETCETRLKSGLAVFNKAMAAKDYMWEINHPFPFEQAGFVEAYEGFLAAVAAGQDEDSLKARARLKKILAPEDWEYMTWQEWKEGLARFLENKVKDRFGLKENHGGLDKPFSRVIFYEGGSQLIAWYDRLDHGAVADPEKLYPLISR